MTNSLLKKNKKQKTTKDINTFNYGDIAVGGWPQKEEPLLGEIHLFSLLTDICIFMGEGDKKTDISSWTAKISHTFLAKVIP